jgi:hypothetical protein
MWPLVVLELGLAAWLAAALAGRSVRPDDGWWFQVAALTLPVATALTVPAVGAMAVYALVRRRAARQGAVRAVGVLYVGLAAAAWTRLGVPGPVDAPDPAVTPAGTLRLMTLNAGGATSWSPLLLGEEIEARAPDLVAIQEVNLVAVDVPVPGGPAQRAWARPPILGPVLDSAYAVLVSGSDVSALETPMPVFGRVRLLSTRLYTLGEGEGAGQYSRTVFEWDGREAVLYSVHLRSFGESRPWTTGQVGSLSAWEQAAAEFREALVLRAAEAEALKDVLAGERRPFLVAGDFNATPHQWTYAHVAQGLTDALARRGGGWTSATYPDGRPLVPIDGVLASPEWTVEAAWVGPRGLSDHRAVHAWLRLAREGPSQPGPRAAEGAAPKDEAGTKVRPAGYVAQAERPSHD